MTNYVSHIGAYAWARIVTPDWEYTQRLVEPLPSASPLEEKPT